MSIPTYAGPQQQQSRRSRRALYILVGTLAALALIGLIAYVWEAFSSELNSLKQTGSIPNVTTSTS